MPVSREALEKLGIKIDQGQSPVAVYFPSDLSQSTLHDLWLAFEGNITLHPTDEPTEDSKATASRRDTEIFSEVDDYISETDFVKTAEIALSAHDENDAPIVRLFNTLLSAAISREASDLHAAHREKVFPTDSTFRRPNLAFQQEPHSIRAKPHQVRYQRQ